MEVGRAISHYRVIRKLGAGGMGVVYLARDERLSREVALKILPEGSIADEAARKRFHKEALALARLNHTNIGTVYEFGSEDGIDFVVTEYIQGSTLTAQIAERQFTDREIHLLGAQIASALEEAHHQGVLHCDLKPDNMIVTGKGHLKLIDFGVAKLLCRGDSDFTQTLTQAQGIAGTLPYMAPELLRGEPPTEQSDIYALGAVLYELATKRRPFAGDSPAALVGAILSQALPDVRESNPAISEDLARTIARCLNRDPGARYRSAAELGAELTSALAVELTRPAGPNRWALFGKRPLRGLLGIAALTVAIVLGYMFLGGGRALSFSPRDWILTADLENLTGDPLFDRSLGDAFTISLEQSKHANVFPRSRVNEVLRRMGKAAGSRIDEATGRELCVREGIRGLVTFTISKVGRHYALSARLLNPQTGDTVRSYLEQAREEDRVLDALGKVATRIRRDLGESLPFIRSNERPLAQVTTQSLRALKAYSDARYSWDKGAYETGLRQYQEAVTLDPDFAMAHAALASAYCSHIFNDRPQCRDQYRRALERTDRVTERERLFLQADAESDIGQIEEGVRRWNQYLASYPDDSVSRFNLGTLLMRNQRMEEAATQFQEVIRVAPRSAAAYINLATSYSGISRFSEALANYRKAFEFEPTWISSSNLNHEYGFTLVKSGDTAKAREVFALAIAKPGMKPKGLRSLAMLDLYQGKWRDAIGHLREAIELNQAGRAPLSEARDRYHLAVVLGAEDDRNGEIAELDRAARALQAESAPQPWLGARIGVSYARAGTLERAERILRTIKDRLEPNNDVQSADMHWLEGEVALARGNRDHAVELLRLARTESRDAPLQAAGLAYAYEKSGRSDEALAAYQRLIAMKGMSLGWEAQQPWLAAHYQLAELYAAKGDSAKAAQWLDALAQLWKDGDPDLPLLRKASGLRKKLGKG